MTGSRRIHRRPYFFELFSLGNLLLIIVLFHDRNAIIGTLPGTLLSFGSLLALEALLGVVIRCCIAAIRGEFRAYWRIICSPGWLSDTLRMVLIGSCMIHAYLWTKVVVPLLHARRFDQELWNLDQKLFFGMSPNIFVLNLFSSPKVLGFVDFTYVAIFFVSMTFGFVFFLSAPSRRIRMAFLGGTAVMWLAGGWLYVIVPSLGPAYGFPEVWFAYSEALKVTQAAQALLMRNYHHVLSAGGSGGAIDIKLGIGAFPSLHVGMQTFLLLWMRKLWNWGELLFWIFLAIIFLGSLITGWHYLIDGLAGLLLAAGSYLLAGRIYRLARWSHLVLITGSGNRA